MDQLPFRGLADAKHGVPRVLGNAAASLWDIGEGIACFEIHTKLNSFAPAVFDALQPALEKAQSGFRGLVIGNDHERAFSVGADLFAFLGMVEASDWAGLDAYIGRGQDLFLKIKYASVPVVAAAHGLALGGGCEFMLNCNAVVAHTGLVAGLPETRVGIVPGWGGTTQLLLRALARMQPLAAAQSVFDMVYAGELSTSAVEARQMGLLEAGDDIVASRADLLFFARARAIAMADAGYQAPPPAKLHLGGPAAKAAIMHGVLAKARSGLLSDADIAVAEALAGVLTGGAGGDPAAPMLEADVMRLERQAGIELSKRPATIERIEHMLKTGKALRN